MDNREELINALASTMGAGIYGKTEMSENRYDPETGTLYCNGNVIPRQAMDDAIQYMTMMMRRYKDHDPKMYLIYMAAEEGLKKMKEEKGRF